MSVDLLKVDTFGAIDAESDARLGEYFVTTPMYEALVEQQRYIALGRKGSGKTALYRELLNSANSETFVTGLGFADYPWGAHNETSNAQASPGERYVASWRFLILVELAKQVLRDEGRRDPEVSAALRIFIEKTWGQVEFSHRDFFGREEYELVGEFKPQVAGTSLGSIGRRRVERRRIGEALASTLSWLEEALARTMHQKHRYYVQFDELDKSFDGHEEQYDTRLIGLLLAAYRVATWAKDSGVLARAIVFLRTDIFDAISFSDKNKIRDNAVVDVRWTDEEEGPGSLKGLMNERIRRVANISDGSDPWDAVFDPEREMRGTTTKYRHMTRRTHLRPRDMIKFANCALDEAKARLRKGSDQKKIDNEDIARARDPYSAFLVDELDDEIRPTCSEWKTYLEMLRRMRRLDFSRPEISEQYGALKNPPLSLEHVLELLYRYSIIGYVARGGRGGGGEQVFAYSNPDVPFDPGATQFKVHLGLKEVLGLKE